LIINLAIVSIAFLMYKQYTMEQKVPIITKLDINRIINRDFPPNKLDEIDGILKLYKSDGDNGGYRIYASIFKLSDGNIMSLKKYVGMANNDFRDIISMAEYPNYSEHAFEDDLSMEMEKQLITNDWTQYESWLNRA